MSEYYDYSSDEEVIEFRRRNEEAKKAREKARKKLFEEETDETDTSRVRQLARDATARISDEYSMAISKAQEKDRQTLEYIDQLLNQTAIPYATLRKRTAPVVRYCRREEYPMGEDTGAINEFEYSSNMRNNEHRIPYYNTRRSTSSTYPIDRTLPSVRKIDEPKVSETARQRVRRIEAHLDGILDYEVPSAENFKNMRHSLRDINDKLVTHKLLLDRHANADLDMDSRNVSERVEEKYRELEERMPCLSVSERSRAKEHNSRFDPHLIPGYCTGLSITNSDQNAELRGRIRTLLCRTRRTVGSEDTHTNSARRRRDATVKG